MIILLGFKSYSQLEDYDYSIYGGLNLHTTGWGLSATYSKYVNSTNSRLISLDFISLRDFKQQRVDGIETRSKKYVYGKINSAYILKLNYGNQRSLISKNTQKKISVDFIYTGGLSLAMIKPIYVNVYDQITQKPSLVKYNPFTHGADEIYGRGPNFNGVNEMTAVLGGNINLGLGFDYSTYSEFVRRIELGVSIDYFIKPLPIMAFVDNRTLHPNLYIKFLFGREY